MVLTCQQRAWSLGVGSRDYPYFTNSPKNAGLRFHLPTYAFSGGGLTPPHPPCDGPVYILQLALTDFIFSMLLPFSYLQ